MQYQFVADLKRSEDKPKLLALCTFFQTISSFPSSPSFCVIFEPSFFERHATRPFYSLHTSHIRELLIYAQNIGDGNVPIDPLEYYKYAEISTPAQSGNSFGSLRTFNIYGPLICEYTIGISEWSFLERHATSLWYFWKFADLWSTLRLSGSPSETSRGMRQGCGSSSIQLIFADLGFTHSVFGSKSQASSRGTRQGGGAPPRTFNVRKPLNSHTVSQMAMFQSTRILVLHKHRWNTSKYSGLSDNSERALWKASTVCSCGGPPKVSIAVLYINQSFSSWIPG